MTRAEAEAIIVALVTLREAATDEQALSDLCFTHHGVLVLAIWLEKGFYIIIP